MAALTRQLSVIELRDRILAMATTGVYRQSLFEAFQPVANKTQIRSAIAQAKRLGLKSVAALRDKQLGTYYQLDARRYEALQQAPQSALQAVAGADAVAGAEQVDQAIATTRIIRTMLALAGGMTLMLAAIAALCIGWGHSQMGLAAGLAAGATGLLWRLQHWATIG
ncbi:MAG: hypothetical protein AAGF66_13775 [Cyanobacteria bacterium P01_H01_bin.119]